MTGDLIRKLPRFVDPSGEPGTELNLLGMEDALVSDAFGALRFLNRGFLVRALRGAKRSLDEAPMPDWVFDAILADPWGIDMSFWPSWQAPLDFPDGFAWSCEPDVVIGPSTAGPWKGKRVLIVIEAKYLGSELGSDVSQLAREYFCGMKTASGLASVGREVDFLLLCVTRHRRIPLVPKPGLSDDGKAIVGKPSDGVPPHNQVAAYLRLVGEYFRRDLKEVCHAWASEAASRIYHVGWKDVARVFEEGQADLDGGEPEGGQPELRTREGSRRLAEEAARLLLDMRNLRGFRGFEPIGRLSIEGQFPGRTHCFLDLATLKSGRGERRRKSP